MRLHILALTMAMGGALAWSAPGGAQPAPASPAPAQVGAQQDGLDSADKDFLENAAQAGHTEIEGSKMAEQKSQSADVKTFASRMIADHGKVGEELNALAQRKGYTPPTEPSLMQKAKLKTLQMRDEGFDKAYADQIGVSAHEDAVKLFQKASAEAKDADVKAFAAKTLPSLEEHLSMAKALQQKVGAK